MRHFDEEHVDRVKGYRRNFPYEKALRKRRVLVEPLFAKAKDWHAMRRFRLRQLKKINAEALLIATGQNVKRLLVFRGRGPGRIAQAVALRPPGGSRLHLVSDHRLARRCVFQQADKLRRMQSTCQAFQDLARLPVPKFSAPNLRSALLQHRFLEILSEDGQW